MEENESGKAGENENLEFYLEMQLKIRINAWLMLFYYKINMLLKKKCN